MFYPNREFKVITYKGFAKKKPESSAQEDSAVSKSISEEEDSSLGSSNVFICHKPQERQRKGKPMTSHAKRMVKSCAHVLEKEAGKENIAFLTLTLPGLSEEELETCNKRFYEIMRQMCQWLRRRLNGADLNDEYVCVTEIQSKRFKERNEVALHAHLIFQGRKNRYTNWAISKDEIKEVWGRLLSNALLHKRIKKQVDTSFATRIESVKHSVSKYLGKYMSKGNDVVNAVIEAGKQDELPPKWDRISDSLRKRVKAMIIVPKEAAKMFLADNIEALKEQGIVSWYFPIKLDFSQIFSWFDEKIHGEAVKVIGYCGEFATEEYMNQIAAIQNP